MCVGVARRRHRTASLFLLWMKIKIFVPIYSDSSGCASASVSVAKTFSTSAKRKSNLSRFASNIGCTIVGYDVPLVSVDEKILAYYYVKRILP
jgi:hypothetical protein